MSIEYARNAAGIYPSAPRQNRATHPQGWRIFPGRTSESSRPRRRSADRTALRAEWRSAPGPGKTPPAADPGRQIPRNGQFFGSAWGRKPPETPAEKQTAAGIRRFTSWDREPGSMELPQISARFAASSSVHRCRFQPPRLNPEPPGAPAGSSRPGQ